MKRIRWINIALCCGGCGRVTYRPPRGSRDCQWCDGKLRELDGSETSA